MFPKSWEGLRGTLDVQLAHLRDHIATLPVMVGFGKSRMVFSLTPQRKAKMLALKSEGRYMHTRKTWRRSLVFRPGASTSCGRSSRRNRRRRHA